MSIGSLQGFEKILREEKTRNRRYKGEEGSPVSGQGYGGMLWISNTEGKRGKGESC